MRDIKRVSHFRKTICALRATGANKDRALLRERGLPIPGGEKTVADRWCVCVCSQGRRDVQAADEGQAPQRRRNWQCPAEPADAGRAAGSRPQEFRLPGPAGQLRGSRLHVLAVKVFAEELRRHLRPARLGGRCLAPAGSALREDAAAGRGLQARHGRACVHRRARA